jgi:hypothetical protein
VAVIVVFQDYADFPGSRRPDPEMNAFRPDLGSDGMTAGDGRE